VADVQREAEPPVNATHSNVGGMQWIMLLCILGQTILMAGTQVGEWAGALGGIVICGGNSLRFATSIAAPPAAAEKGGNRPHPTPMVDHGLTPQARNPTFWIGDLASSVNYL
jgi:hypothetical protein